jgi:signal peptidase I
MDADAQPAGQLAPSAEPVAEPAGTDPAPPPPDTVAPPPGDSPPTTPGTSPPPPPGTSPPEKEHSGRWVIELVAVVVVAIVVAILLRTFVAATYSIPSGSMEPTLQIGDRIVVDKLAYHLHGVGTGDIIVFSTPPNENCAGPPVADLVKRVIGLPGQTVSLSSGGRVYINGKLLIEPWLPSGQRADTYPGPSGEPYALHQPYRVPAGDVYVMGDNRTQSCDSRYWGPVRQSTIVGKVDVRLWPFSRLGVF